MLQQLQYLMASVSWLIPYPSSTVFLSYLFLARICLHFPNSTGKTLCCKDENAAQINKYFDVRRYRILPYPHRSLISDRSILRKWYCILESLSYLNLPYSAPDIWKLSTVLIPFFEAACIEMDEPYFRNATGQVPLPCVNRLSAVLAFRRFVRNMTFNLWSLTHSSIGFLIDERVKKRTLPNDWINYWLFSSQITRSSWVASAPAESIFRNFGE